MRLLMILNWFWWIILINLINDQMYGNIVFSCFENLYLNCFPYKMVSNLSFQGVVCSNIRAPVTWLRWLLILLSFCIVGCILILLWCYNVLCHSTCLLHPPEINLPQVYPINGLRAPHKLMHIINDIPTAIK